MSSSGGLGRRGFLVLGAGLLTGCSGSSAQGPDGSRSSDGIRSPGGTSSLGASPPGPGGTPSPGGSPSGPSGPSSGPGATSPSPSATTPSGQASPSSPTLPAVRSWVPGAGEIQPELKRLAVEATVDLLRRPGARTVVEVIDAQYGGILANSASVLVPCRTHTITGGRVVTGGTTVDVRLTKSGGTWRVTALHPARPGAATSRLSAAARQVLANDRIALPPASAADVRSGQVHDIVLTAMLELARAYRIGVSVIRSGHPQNVFGTDRPSDHPLGRAFDTWQINNRPVVDPATPRSLITSYMRATAAAGSDNVGGPYQLPGATYFSDRTHHDHIHAGFPN